MKFVIVLTCVCCVSNAFFSCAGQMSSVPESVDSTPHTQHPAVIPDISDLISTARAARTKEAEAHAIAHFLDRATSGIDRWREPSPTKFIVAHEFGPELGKSISSSVAVVLTTQDGVEVAIEDAGRGSATVARVISIERSCEMYIGHYEVSVMENTYTLGGGLATKISTSVSVFCLIKRDDLDWRIVLVGGGLS